MHKFALSFEVISSQMTLDEISNVLGVSCTPPPVSREKGSFISEKRGRRNERTWWRLFADSSNSEATLEQQFKMLFGKMTPLKMPPEDIRAALAADCELRIDVAVFYDVEEEAFLFELGPEILREINRYHVDLEVCLY